MKQGLISLNPVRPDHTITAAALVWCEALDLEDAAAMTGLSPTQIVDIIESRLNEVRVEHVRLTATGQLQELIGRTDLAKILTKLRTHIEDMSPGQLLATGSFMHAVSGLQQDRQLVSRNEQPKFSIKVLSEGDSTPAGFRGLVLSFNASGEDGVTDN
jgi:hypothetical protein